MPSLGPLVKKTAKETRKTMFPMIYQWISHQNVPEIIFVTPWFINFLRTFWTFVGIIFIGLSSAPKVFVFVNTSSPSGIDFYLWHLNYPSLSNISEKRAFRWVLTVFALEWGHYLDIILKPSGNKLRKYGDPNNFGRVCWNQWISNSAAKSRKLVTIWEIARSYKIVL